MAYSKKKTHEHDQWKKNLAKKITDIPESLKKNEAELHDEHYKQLKKYVKHVRFLINTNKFDIKSVVWLQADIAKRQNDYLHYFMGDILYFLAYTWDKKQFLKEVLECFNRAIKINQKFVWALYNRSFLLMHHFKRNEDAFKDCNCAIKINSNCASAYIVRGELRSRLGSVKLAIGDFNKAIKMADNNDYKVTALLGRANCWKLQQKFVLALRDFKQVGRIGTGQAVLTATLGEVALLELKKWEIFQQSVDLQRDFLLQSPNQHLEVEWGKMQAEHTENFPLLSFMGSVFFGHIEQIRTKEFDFNNDIFCQQTLFGLCMMKFVIGLCKKSNERVPYFKLLLDKIISKYMSESFGGLISRGKFNLSILNKFVTKFIMEIKKHHKFVDICSPILKQINDVAVKKHGVKSNLKKWLLDLEKCEQKNQKEGEKAKQERENILEELLAEEARNKKKVNRKKKGGGKSKKKKRNKGRNKNKQRQASNKKEKAMVVIPLRKLPACLPLEPRLRAKHPRVTIHKQFPLLVGMFKEKPCNKKQKINVSPYGTLIPAVVRHIMDETKSKLKGGAYLWLWDKLIDRSKTSIMPEPDDWDLTSNLDLEGVLNILSIQDEFKLNIINNINTPHAHLIIKYTSQNGQLIKIDMDSTYYYRTEGDFTKSNSVTTIDGLLWNPAKPFNLENLRRSNHYGGILDLKKYKVCMNPNIEIDSDLTRIFRLVLTMAKVRYFRCKLTPKISDEFYKINFATFAKIKKYAYKLYNGKTRINPYGVCYSLIRGFCRGYGAKYFSFLCEYKLLWLLPFWRAIKPYYNERTYTDIIEQLERIDQEILQGKIKYDEKLDELAGRVFALLFKPYIEQQQSSYINALWPFRQWLSYYRGDTVYANILKNLQNQPNFEAARQQHYGCGNP